MQDLVSSHQVPSDGDRERAGWPGDQCGSSMILDVSGVPSSRLSDSPPAVAAPTWPSRSFYGMGLHMAGKRDARVLNSSASLRSAKVRSATA